MDIAKWDNLVRADLRTGVETSQVLTAGLSRCVARSSPIMQRVWIQLFGEGFNKVRLAQNILKELNAPSSEEFLKTVDETERGRALDNLDRLKAKFNRSGASSAVSILDECICKIRRVIYERSQSLDGVTKPRLLSCVTDSSESIGPESPRELTPRVAPRSVDSNEENKAQINEDIRAYSPDIQTALQERMRHGWTNGRVFDPKEVRQMANEMVLEKLVGRFSKESVEASLKAYCGDRPDRMNYEAFIALVNIGGVKLDAAIEETVRVKCEVLYSQFGRMIRDYMETVSSLPTLGPKAAIRSVSYVLQQILDKQDVSERQVYLATYSKLFLGRTAVELDPEAKLELTSGRSRVKTIPIMPEHLERAISFVKAMHPFLNKHRVLAQKEREFAAATKDFDVARGRMETEIGDISKQVEALDRSCTQKEAIKRELTAKTNAFVEASPSGQAAILKQIELLNARLMEMGNVEAQKAEKIAVLESKNQRFAALLTTQQARLERIEVERAACKVTNADFKFQLEIATIFA